MPDFQLHPRLGADSHRLGESSDSLLLLMNNALVPWFILVPKTPALELHWLDSETRSRIRAEMDAIADFLEQEFRPDKLNIATLGNLVPQLHIHLIGRFQGDFCWPAPVWGRPERQEYAMPEVERMRERVGALLGQLFLV
jgi:diadenosine tetraphosphate (Ap4A) HIT family hydrolase